MTTYPLFGSENRLGVQVRESAEYKKFWETTHPASGAVGLACVLSGKIDARGKTIAVVMSGGNIDPDVLAKAKRLEV